MDHSEVSEEIIAAWSDADYEKNEDYRPVKFVDNVEAYFKMSESGDKVASALLTEPQEVNGNVSAEIKGVYTVPEQRREGKMKELLEKIERYARGNGIFQLRIGTALGNKAMRALCRKLDYKLESEGEEYGARYVKNLTS